MKAKTIITTIASGDSKAVDRGKYIIRNQLGSRVGVAVQYDSRE